jgi:F0F1-type ATP synthase assembly protein I
MGQEKPKNQKLSVLNITIIGVIGQVGLLTLVIILGALFGGLWLDNANHSRPVFTLIALAVSIPVSIIIMLLVVRGAMKKLKLELPEKHEGQEKESDFGKDE